MPIISSRSLNEFNTLKSTGILKENGIKIELGKELLSIATLETMLSNYQKGNLDTSISSAEIFVESCLETLKSLESKSDVPKEDALNTQNVPGDWRIASILAKNFRGLTEWNGEFEFNFDRKPYFLFGLNGSGKTNILGAIIWCLTGMCLKDRCEPDIDDNQGIDLFDTNDASKPVISSWPYVVTVPHNKTPKEMVELKPTCSVEIILQDENNKSVTAKRELGNSSSCPFEVMDTEGNKIKLENIGISQLDLEVSLLMPARVKTIQFEPGSKISENLISIAGLDAILDIGGFARKLSASISRYRNGLEKEIKDLRNKAVEATRNIEGEEYNDIWITLNKVKDDNPKTEKESNDCYENRLLNEQVKTIDEQAKKEFQVVSDALGVAPASQGERKNLIDSLRNARIRIGENSDNWEPIKSWILISLDAVNIAVDDLEKKSIEIKKEIETQYPLWLKNMEEHGLLQVKSYAAKYCKEINSFESCPVCGEKFNDIVKKEIEELAKKKDSLVSNIRQLINEMHSKVETSLPEEIKGLKIDKTAIDQIRNMVKENVWNHISAFEKIKNDFATKVKEIIGKLNPQEEVKYIEYFGNKEWHKNFLSELEKIEECRFAAQKKLSMAKWILENLSTITTELESLIFSSSEKESEESPENKDALIPKLNDIEQYSGQFKILDFVRNILNNNSKKYEKMDSLAESVDEADKIYEIVNNLKDLDKYANTILTKELDSVATEMKANYDDLYPTDPIRLETIASQKARAGTKPDYRFRLKWSDKLLTDAEPVANLGRMRAILWSFTFALIQKHNPNIKSVIIDDPFISLDDFHAKNMFENIIAQKLAVNFQTIVTIHQEHLFHERWGRDPYRKTIGLAKVLTRDEHHRKCRIQAGWEPLSNAIDEFQNDRDKYMNVLNQARILLETNLIDLGSYLMRDDISSSTIDNIIEKLKQVSANSKNATPICKCVKIGILLEIYRDQVAKKLLHISHHGGPDRSTLSAHDADDVVKMYKKWRDVIQDRYKEIDAAIDRKQMKATLDVESLTEPLQVNNVLIEFRPEKPIQEIGSVAAEGEFTVFTDNGEELNSFSWPTLNFGIVTTPGLRPVAWEGQIALFAPNLDVEDGDLALMQTNSENFLRRVFKVSINDGTQSGWAGNSINPNLQNIKPVFFKNDDVALFKCVGILYPNERERVTLSGLSRGEVVKIDGKWPVIMQLLMKDKVKLIRIYGNSADPVAMDGQYLLVEKKENVDSSFSMKPCCVVLNDSRSVFKRFSFSSDSNNKAILQPFNTTEPHHAIEVNLSNDDEGNTLPVIQQIFAVIGVIFSNPEDMNKMAL